MTTPSPAAREAAARLEREYRPTMDKDVLHAWAQDVVHVLATLREQNSAAKELVDHARQAVSGEGPRAYDWQDKPHRLIYDLCSALEASGQNSTMRAGDEQAALTRATAAYLIGKSIGKWMSHAKYDKVSELMEEMAHELIKRIYSINVGNIPEDFEIEGNRILALASTNGSADGGER